jgi:hypothetical protein
LELEEASLKTQAGAIAARLAKIEAERQIARKTGQQRQEQTAKERKEMAATRKAD